VNRQAVPRVVLLKRETNRDRWMNTIAKLTEFLPNRNSYREIARNRSPGVTKKPRSVDERVLRGPMAL
jgi:hypothetical protein